MVEEIDRQADFKDHDTAKVIAVDRLERCRAFVVITVMSDGDIKVATAATEPMDDFNLLAGLAGAFEPVIKDAALVAGYAMGRCESDD